MLDVLKITLIVLVAELPCILRTTALQLQSGKLYSVISGTLLGSVLALAIGLLLAFMMPSAKESSWVNFICGVILAGVGFYIMVAER